jgi:recombination protein RecA
MSKKLDQVIGDVEKRFGKGTVRSMEDYVDVEKISSGSIGLDMALGGGYPKGRVIEVYGAESSGKTTTALHAAVQVQKVGKIVLYMDYENAIDPFYCESIGLDISANKFRLVNPDSTEDGFEIMRSFLDVEDIGMIVVDSVAAMTPKAELQGDFGDSKMGLQARSMSQGLRMLTQGISKSNCIVMFINQTRNKIGVMFGSPITTTGGNALKFYASQRLDISKAAGEKDSEGEFTSILSKIKVIKNKVAPPMKKCEIPIKFGVGFDTLSEIIDIATELGIILKKGSWYSYEDSKLGQGKDAVRAIMEDNPEMTDEIERKVKLNLGLLEE